MLKLERVGIHDNFFELGGDSILSMQIMSRAKRAGIAVTPRQIFERQTVAELAAVERLPVSVLFQEPTVAHLARLLRSYASLSAQSPVVPIQPNGTRPPVFLVHGAGGNVFDYQPLARALGDDQPFYGIQSPGLDGEEAAFTTIEAMAAHYVAEIRVVQPAGPYRLGGWSMGGAVAFEMARQLAAQGERVDHLVLLDSLPPNPGARDPRLQLESFARALGLLPGSLPIDWEHVLELGAEEQLDHVLEQAKVAGMTLPDLDLPQVRRLFEIYKANSRALADYRPQRYGGRVLLLWASDTPPLRPVPHNASPWRRAKARMVKLFKSEMGWGDLATVEVGMVPGDHYTMLQPPHVEKLAAAVAAWLAEDQAQE